MQTACLRATSLGAFRLHHTRGCQPFPALLAASPRAKRCRAEPEDRQAADAKPLDSEWVQEVAAEVLDTSQLGQRGEAWFAAQAVLLLLVVVPPEPLRPLLSTVGWLATAAGLGLVVAGQQALGTNLTPLPQPRKSATLSTGGIFGYVRHPMYGGLVLAALGYGLASGDELRLLMAIALFFVLDAKASVEEGLLAEKFGADYTALVAKAKKLVPLIY